MQMASEKANIKVVVRIRPLNQKEAEQKLRHIVRIKDSTTLLFHKEDEKAHSRSSKKGHDLAKRSMKHAAMEFDRIFDTDTDNNQIYEECISPMVNILLTGYNCSVFAYGATGTGKTFTMLGNSFTPGLMYLTMSDLFHKLEDKRDEITFDVGVCYMEVWNEQVWNLLTKTGPLKLQENSRGVVVNGLKLKPIYNTKDLQDLMLLGNSNRTQHPTDANAESSRSHAIFQAHVHIMNRKTNVKHIAKLSLVDLAGSERATVKKVSSDKKSTKADAKADSSINKSLLALCHCINKLCAGEKHIPYRDSNLTRLLKDSLGGNCKTLMVVNVSKSALAYEDTFNSLMYASRAMNICTSLQQNVVKPTVGSRYENTVKELKSANERLKETNKALTTTVEHLKKTTTSPNAIANELKPWYKRIDEVYAAAIGTHKAVIELQSKIKNLNFRSKLKENTEAFNKILKLNKMTSQERLARFTNSVSRLAQQINKNNDELTRMRLELAKSNMDLGDLRREIGYSEYADILQIYLKSKDLELQNAKKSVNINHISIINTELVQDSLKMRQAFTMACMILQQSYEHLQANGKLCPEMRRNFEELQRLMRSKSISFEDEHKQISQPMIDFHALEAMTARRFEHMNNGEDLESSSSVQKEEVAVDVEEPIEN